MSARLLTSDTVTADPFTLKFPSQEYGMGVMCSTSTELAPLPHQKHRKQRKQVHTPREPTHAAAEASQLRFENEEAGEGGRVAEQ